MTMIQTTQAPEVQVQEVKMTTIDNSGSESSSSGKMQHIMNEEPDNFFTSHSKLQIPNYETLMEHTENE